LIREERSKRPGEYKIRRTSERVALPGKDGPVEAELMAMKLGPDAFLTMSGEPFVECSLRLEQAITDRATPTVIGYANGGIGYIATAEANRYGVYEPTQSPLRPEAEIHRELSRLADRVNGDAFETSSKHPPGCEIKVETRCKGRAGRRRRRGLERSKARTKRVGRQRCRARLPRSARLAPLIRPGQGSPRRRFHVLCAERRRAGPNRVTVLSVAPLRRLTSARNINLLRSDNTDARWGYGQPKPEVRVLPQMTHPSPSGVVNPATVVERGRSERSGRACLSHLVMR
jgi:hypothetical protein